MDYQLWVPKKICDKFQIFGTLEDLPKSGRPRDTSTRIDSIILRKSGMDSSKSSRMIKEELSLNVSSRTVQRWQNNKELRSYFAKKKPFISAKNKKARLAFAKLHFHKTQSFWESIIWSDESKFELKNTKRRKRVDSMPK